ncbi:MAG TPA: TetR/AcrR family transcriptional regulator [Marmoricola sp.]|nr:TetR/AcrR family transcriptional regulator [Marmoricola sp.]
MTSNRHAPESVERPETGADDAYLDAAREMILEVGWSRTRLTDIARRAGVSRMTLYRRWPDMQSMLADLMTREWGRALGETVAQAQEDSTADTRTRLTRGVVATVRALRTNPLLRRIVELDPERLLPYLLERRGRSQEQIATLLAELVRAGQRDGSIRAGDPDQLARSVLLACHGFTLSAHTMVGETGDDRDADVSAYDAELTELVERYLRP